jgi:hypothetical protein
LANFLVSSPITGPPWTSRHWRTRSLSKAKKNLKDGLLLLDATLCSQPEDDMVFVIIDSLSWLSGSVKDGDGETTSDDEDEDEEADSEEDENENMKTMVVMQTISDTISIFLLSWR